MGDRNKEKMLCLYCDLGLFFIPLLSLFKVSYRERLWIFVLGLSIPAATSNFSLYSQRSAGAWSTYLCNTVLSVLYILIVVTLKIDILQHTINVLNTLHTPFCACEPLQKAWCVFWGLLRWFCLTPLNITNTSHFLFLIRLKSPPPKKKPKMNKSRTLLFLGFN